MHTVLVAEPPNEERFLSPIAPSVLVAPAGGGAAAALAVLQLGILLAQVADAQRKADLLTTALAPEQVRLQNTWARCCAKGSSNKGFEARVVVLPALAQSAATPPWMRGQAFDDALPELRRQGPADAALLFLLDAQLRPDSATPGLCPALVVTARAVDLGSAATLYGTASSTARARRRPPHHGALTATLATGSPTSMRCWPTPACTKVGVPGCGSLPTRSCPTSVGAGHQ